MTLYFYSQKSIIQLHIIAIPKRWNWWEQAYQWRVSALVPREAHSITSEVYERIVYNPYRTAMEENKVALDSSAVTIQIR